MFNRENDNNVTNLEGMLVNAWRNEQKRAGQSRAVKRQEARNMNFLLAPVA